MKVVAVREAKASLSEYIDKAQRDRVLITKHGKPAALLTMGNPRFWEMIEDRRREQGSTTLAEVRARYGVPKLPKRRGAAHSRRLQRLTSRRQASSAFGASGWLVKDTD